jgi:hypothetical protein
VGSDYPHAILTTIGFERLKLLDNKVYLDGISVLDGFYLAIMVNKGKYQNLVN